MSATTSAASVRVVTVQGSAVMRAATAVVHQAVRGIGVMARRFVAPGRADIAPASSLPSFEAAALPHLDATYNFARYLCRDPDKAEDVVQEAYLRAYRGWPEFRGGSVRAWLFTIVRNCHFTLLEQSRRGEAQAHAPRTGDDEEAADDPVLRVAAEGDPELTLIRQDEAASVRGVLASLPDDAREILVLRDIEDCSYREIADALELPIGTVMSRLSRARRAFAARWEKIMQDPRR